LHDRVIITIGKEGSNADLIVPDETLDFSVEISQFQDKVDATLVGDTEAELDEPNEITVRRDEYSYSSHQKYCVCTLEKHNAVLLFEDGDFNFKKNIVDPGTPNVTDTGTVILTGYTDGGYQEGKHYLYIWNEAGNLIFKTEFQATVNVLRISRDTRFIACKTADVLLKNQPDSGGPRGRYDYSIYIIDVEAKSVRTRYTDQMPGISTGGPNLQIWDIQFVYQNSEPLIALFDVREPNLPDTENLTPADLPTGTPLIDMDGNLIDFSHPNLDRYPDHYSLTNKGQNHLDER
jgi:hypothetical protein